MISKEQVKHIAKLARLSLSEAEILKFQKELSSILDYVDQLKELKSDKTRSNYQPFEHELGKSFSFLLRKDEPLAQSEETRKKLLNLMPQKRGRHIKTRSVFEKENYD